MNKSQVSLLDGMVENQLESMHNDKGHRTTFHQREKHIRGTANNHSAPLQVVRAIVLTVCSHSITIENIN